MRDEPESLDSIKDKLLNLFLTRRPKPKTPKVADITIVDPFERFEKSLKRDLEEKKLERENEKSQAESKF